MIKKERSNDGFIELRLQGGNIKAGSGVAVCIEYLRRQIVMDWQEDIDAPVAVLGEKARDRGGIQRYLPLIFLSA